MSQGQLGPLNPLVGLGSDLSSKLMETPEGKHLGVCISEAESGHVLAVSCENWLRLPPLSTCISLPESVNGLKSQSICELGFTLLHPQCTHLTAPRIHPPYCPSVPPTSPSGLLPAGPPLLEALTLPSQEGSSTAWLKVPSYSLKYTFMLWRETGSVKLGPSMQCSQPLKPRLTPKPCFIQAAAFQTLPCAY